MEPNGARDVRVISDQVNGHKELAVDLGEAHDLLMKGRDHRGVYVNSLSSWEMESLTALCDTYLPSLDLSDVTTDESTVKFYGTSASMAGTPERVSLIPIYPHLRTFSKIHSPNFLFQTYKMHACYAEIS